MKIFNTAGKLIYDLPSKPRKRDVSSNGYAFDRSETACVSTNPNCSVAFKATGWARGNKFGIEDADGNVVVLGTCSNIERARYQLKQVSRAYIDGAETYTVKEA